MQSVWNVAKNHKKNTAQYLAMSIIFLNAPPERPHPRLPSTVLKRAKVVFSHQTKNKRFFFVSFVHFLCDLRGFFKEMPFHAYFVNPAVTGKAFHPYFILPAVTGKAFHPYFVNPAITGKAFHPYFVNPAVAGKAFHPYFVNPAVTGNVFHAIQVS